ncbi:MAG: glycosyltransferase family 9 protein [Verrucomicrobiales bacterium]|nr:glycosyltransferase family 9 protein [Verrucomicrobiales bacterium]
MSQTQGRILVIRGGAIGDFILTLPVFAALRQQFPQTHLEVLGYPHIAQLALAGRLVDRLQSIEARALAGFFARGGVLDAHLCEYFASFAVVISYLYDPDEIFRTNFARCSKAQFLAGLHRPDERSGLHATEMFLKPLERLAIFEADPVPRLMMPTDSHWLISSADRSAMPPTQEGLAPLRVALHPGSGSEQKNWPETRWDELIGLLIAKTSWNFLLAGGEAEGIRLDHFARLIPPERLQMAQNVPLADLAIRLRQCDLFVGHDSGISHLAAAVGLRGLALWGETNPAIWRPRGDRISILRSEAGLAWLDAETVSSALLRLSIPGS